MAKDYFAPTTANVISTAGDAALSVADPSSIATGHLVNGTFSLPQALQAKRRRRRPVRGGRRDGGPDAAADLDGTVSQRRRCTIEFKQTIGANDALRTGTYSKTLTFTLSTTMP